jgi:hypothetical protein
MRVKIWTRMRIEVKIQEAHPERRKGKRELRNLDILTARGGGGVVGVSSYKRGSLSVPTPFVS